MSFVAQLRAEQARVDAALATLFQPRNQLPEDRVWNACCHAVRAGGKRLRPILCLAAARLAGDDPDRDARALGAGLAIEMLHSYSLVHDDLPAMDDADSRRGQPSVHIAYDEATAILAGDALLTLAFEHMAPLGSALVIGLARASGVGGMIGGQMLDILSERAGAAMDQPTLRRLQAKKTGALIRFSVIAGGEIAALPAAQLQALDRFGAGLGLAFQVWDDVLDATADALTLGKPVGADAAAQKSTFVSLLGLAGAQAFARATITQAQADLRAADIADPFLLALADFVVQRSS